MRLKIILPVLGLGFALVAGVLWLRAGTEKARPTSPGLAPANSAANPALQAEALPRPKSVSPSIPPVSPPKPSVADSSADSPTTSQEAYVAARVAELQDLASDDAPASLETIVSELTNRDPEIRKAAREAAIQFGSRDAIPRLMDAIAQTDDVREKAALLEAAEYLKLPTPAELAGTSLAGHGMPPLRNGAIPPIQNR